MIFIHNTDKYDSLSASGLRFFALVGAFLQQGRKIDLVLCIEDVG